MLAAYIRGHEIYHVNSADLAVDHNQVTGPLQRTYVHSNNDKPFSIEEGKFQSLDSMDVIWIRTDPPVNRTYFYATLLLDLLPSNVQIINRPSTLRDWNEKLSALQYPKWTPRTLVSRDLELIREFSAEFSRVTIKPIDGHGGVGIIFASSNDRNFDERISEATHHGAHWIIVQEYLSAAVDGDKRILILNGKPLGAILRLHSDDAELNNLDQGGNALPSSLTQRDMDICDVLAEDLISGGIVFAGIDVIGGMLIEINITSPTGLQEMTRFDGVSYHEQIIASTENTM